MRLIDADALYHLLPIDRFGHINTTITKLNIAEEKCKVDAVPVVRCKDCTYWEQAKPDSGSCNRAFEITAYANDFCSYGERKDEVENA